MNKWRSLEIVGKAYADKKNYKLSYQPYMGQQVRGEGLDRHCRPHSRSTQAEKCKELLASKYKRKNRVSIWTGCFAEKITIWK